MARIFKQVVTSDTGLGIGKFVDSNTQYPVITYLQQWATPVAATTNYVLTTTAMTTAAQTVPAASLAHATLDFPRNVTAVFSGTCTTTVTVNGIDYDGNVISEVLSVVDTTPTVGVKAFASITSVVLAARSAGAVNAIVGMGSKLGLYRQIVDLDVIGSVDEVFEGTRPTVNTTNNTVLFNTALNNSKTYRLKYDSSDYDG